MGWPSTRCENTRARRSVGAWGMALAALCLCAGCTAQPAKTESAPATQVGGGSTPDAPAAPRYDLRGKVTAVDVAAKTVTVDHEAIPGFMGAMTMPYTAKDPRQLEQLKPGDLITAKAGSTRAEYWLEDIVVTGQVR